MATGYVEPQHIASQDIKVMIMSVRTSWYDVLDIALAATVCNTVHDALCSARSVDPFTTQPLEEMAR